MIRSRVALAIGVVCLFSGISPAQTRWCSIIGKADEDRLLYPPLARVALLHGVVLAHLTFMPTGEALKVESVSGPTLLSQGVLTQMKTWSVLTDAHGPEACQTLIIAEFSLGTSSDGNSISSAATLNLPSIYRISVHAEQLVISDPGGELHQTFRGWLRWHLLRMRRLLHA